MINRYLDMAFFYDTGKVAPTRSELDLHGLKDDFGIGSVLSRPLLDAAARRAGQKAAKV